jgi:hypothetical protein
MNDILITLKGAIMPELDVYQLNGFTDRRDYLNALADEYDVDSSTVFVLADMLGKSEDFDGLISSIQDIGV